jgi:hypothetical protein
MKKSKTHSKTKNTTPNLLFYESLDLDKKETKEVPKEVALDGSPLLENPLPLPKKHEKRTMGYAFEPKEEQLKYDIIIPDYDDFDV